MGRTWMIKPRQSQDYDGQETHSYQPTGHPTIRARVQHHSFARGVGVTVSASHLPLWHPLRQFRSRNPGFIIASISLRN